jgi:hypothetical protein
MDKLVARSLLEKAQEVARNYSDPARGVERSAFLLHTVENLIEFNSEERQYEITAM